MLDEEIINELTIYLAIKRGDQQDEYSDVPTVEQNAADFIAWCDARGIQSQPDL